jgi:HEAT repeat protein
MLERRGTRLGIGVVVVVAAAAAVGYGVARRGHRVAPRQPSSVAIDANTSLPVLAQGLREGDARSLAALYQRMTTKAEVPARAVVEGEVAHWLEILQGLRAGFVKFGTYGRTSALVVAAKVLDRFALEPAPTRWIETLEPTHELLLSGLSDPDLNLRVEALTELGRLWLWVPGRSVLPVEEQVLSEWHESFHPHVVRRLGDREPKSRLAAVVCLGMLPIDRAAAPAVAYLDDMSPGAGPVRQQVLISFANRPALLSVDAILKRLYDPEPGVPETAELVLQARGLTMEQISLGRMIFHPKPELRSSVIPLLRQRTDIDPVVWLLQLSHDPEESVRIAAVEALGGRLSPEVRQRLAEMVKSDRSEAVRQAAGKIVPQPPETTASLPPLPGSASLNPKAN